MSSQNKYVDEKHLHNAVGAILKYARKNSVGLSEIREIIKRLNDNLSTFRSAEEIVQDHLNASLSLFGIILSASDKMNKPRLPLYSFYARVALASEDPAHPARPTRLLGYVDPFRRRFYFADEKRVPGFIEIEKDTRIERCTGLQDSQGVPIFEGDKILHTSCHLEGVVIFDKEWNRFEFKPVNFSAPPVKHTSFPLAKSSTPYYLVVTPKE